MGTTDTNAIEPFGSYNITDKIRDPENENLAPLSEGFLIHYVRTKPVRTHPNTNAEF